MIKVVIIKDSNGKTLACEQLGEVTPQKYNELNREAKKNEQERNTTICEIIEKLIELENRVKSLENQMDYDHGKIDSMEDEE